jgi:hypothetical protein
MKKLFLINIYLPNCPKKGSLTFSEGKASRKKKRPVLEEPGGFGEDKRRVFIFVWR